MASVAPDEGLDILLNLLMNDQAVFPTLYAGLFISHSPITVPATNMVLATEAGIDEAGGTGYNRVAIDDDDWSAPAAGGGGRQRTSIQKEFAAIGAGGWGGNANGGFIATTQAVGTGKCLYAANFVDGTAIDLTVVGRIVRVTPTFRAKTPVAA